MWVTVVYGVVFVINDGQDESKVPLTSLENRVSYEINIIVACAARLPAHRGRPQIVGGEDVDPIGKYPWQASLVVVGGSHNCGASLISNRHLTTAAHCVPRGP